MGTIGYSKYCRFNVGTRKVVLQAEDLGYLKVWRTSVRCTLRGRKVIRIP